MLEAGGIKKEFGTLQVLRGIDLSVEKGELLSVTGASGAGKSTLLQILGTLMTPSEGTLSIDGYKIFENGKSCLSGKDLAAFRCLKIGFVFQSHHLLPEFTALENTMMPALIRGLSKAQARQKAEKLLERVGLERRMDHKPSELSGGEQQRVAIARALVNSPAVLFADEPTGNLDSATKEEIHSLLRELRSTLGQTIVLVTHDNSLSSMCDRSVFIADGLLTQNA
ncbi:MAG: ABC transporter ATP-binding protein [Bacteroidales bacterium]|nr:ABC transporter ATP-binding protein [Bacteroidales bacterium]